MLLWAGETLPASRRNEQVRVNIMKRYRSILGDRVFIGVALIGGMTFSGLFAYLSSSPFLFQETYGFSPQQFGLLFAANCVGIEGGVQLSARLARRWDPQWTLVFSTILMATSALLIVIGDHFALGLWGTIAPSRSSSSRVASRFPAFRFWGSMLTDTPLERPPLSWVQRAPGSPGGSLRSLASLA
ncbi:MFS transporter [Arthrobacter sp. Soil762]|uniref:MFS transporter n=1 Tax=Arthrobacter sp. Soil762 TaxID=1736401 RepID=UPI002E0F6F23